MLNGSKALQSDGNDNFESRFGKQFRQFYNLLKRNKQYILNKNIPQ